MGVTLISTTAAERLLRHVESLSEAEARDALRLLVARRERVMAGRLGESAGSRMLRPSDGEHAHGQALDPCRRASREALGAIAEDRS